MAPEKRAPASCAKVVLSKSNVACIEMRKNGLTPSYVSRVNFRKVTL